MSSKSAASPDGSDAVAALRQVFFSNFGGDPHSIVRAPGRVNLIGEHIDYNGYSVLPIAIEQSIFLAAAPSTNGRVSIVNHDPKFTPFSCDVGDIGEIGNPPAWHDYVLCGLYGVHEHLHVPIQSGVNVAVLGKVPPASGLSSSSALVCAAALAGLAVFGSAEERGQPHRGVREHSGAQKCEGSGPQVDENKANGPEDGENKANGPEDGGNKANGPEDGGSKASGPQDDGNEATGNGVGPAHCCDSAPSHSQEEPSLNGVSFKELARVCAMSEKYVGTQGGGMDQAASLLSAKGSAQHISFNPLRCEAVTLPPGACFVVANSLAPANKAATSDFNMRVAECRLATCLLAQANSLPWRTVANMADLQRQLGGLSFDRMTALVEATLHEEPYDLEEVAEALGVPQQEVVDTLLSKNTKGATSFCLRPRALHVFSEAGRVEAFRRTCGLWSEGRSQRTLDETLEELGRLMLASHESTRDQYCCSHELLDQLVQLSTRHALGARLTGAGWGGCTVALVPKDSVVPHCQHLYDNYYKARGVAEDRLEEVLFCSSPAGGAEVVWTVPSL